MRIGLINFHYAFNYGAVLQSTALMKELQIMGHEVILINYRPFYQMQYYLPYPNPFKAFYCAWIKTQHDSFRYRLVFSAKWFVHTLFNYKDANLRKSYNLLFSPYVKKNFFETKLYCRYIDLIDFPPSGFDAFICGSDQLWNPDVTWGVDPAYYLNFGDVKRRIAYAVSPCGLDCKKYYKEVKNAGGCLDFISLREGEKLSEISDILNRDNIVVCPDPTLLLNSKDYSDFEEDIEMQSGKYILFYGFLDNNKNQLLMDLTKKASVKFNLPIIDISLDDFSWHYSNVSKIHVTPGQFLSYIKEAAFIVTNSFHGTVFSIVYRKDFLTVCKTGTSARMEELLDNLDLSGRLYENVGAVYDNVDYSSVDSKLQSIQRCGISYLKKSLN